MRAVETVVGILFLTAVVVGISYVADAKHKREQTEAAEMARK